MTTLHAHVIGEVLVKCVRLVQRQPVFPCGGSEQENRRRPRRRSPPTHQPFIGIDCPLRQPTKLQGTKPGPAAGKSLPAPCSEDVSVARGASERAARARKGGKGPPSVLLYMVTDKRRNTTRYGPGHAVVQTRLAAEPPRGACRPARPQQLTLCLTSLWGLGQSAEKRIGWRELGLGREVGGELGCWQGVLDCCY